MQLFYAPSSEWPAASPPALRLRAERTLQQLSEDSFYPTLHTHKLKGEFAGVWACTVDYDNRILFEFVLNRESNEDEILLLTMGAHDEVYETAWCSAS